jgi:hypothetical protein
VKQDPDVLIQRLMALLQDADDSGVGAYGTINAAQPVYSLEYWDAERRRLRKWRVTRGPNGVGWHLEAWTLNDQLVRVDDE